MTNEMTTQITKKITLKKRPTSKTKSTLLSDKNQAGKERPWRKHKNQAIALAEAFGRNEGYSKVAHRIAGCGKWLKFNVCREFHKKLIAAPFCSHLGCVMCQWRRSMKISFQVRQLGCEHLKKYKSDIPLLLTLTVPNCGAGDFSNTLSTMYWAFNNMFQRVKIKKAVRSWFRGLEVTFNKKTMTYHPHFHVLLMVPENYFTRSRGLYIERDEWLEMWQKATGMPEITQVDIRRCRSKKGNKPGDTIGSVAAEVAKYIAKPSSYIEKLKENYFFVDSEVILTLHACLKGRRLIGFGGLFKELRKKLKQEEIESADLIRISNNENGCSCTFCGSPVVGEETFVFHFGIRNYIRRSD
jgi:plasmid rolling circle replication initiator protein Rep